MGLYFVWYCYTGKPPKSGGMLDSQGQWQSYLSLGTVTWPRSHHIMNTLLRHQQHVKYISKPQVKELKISTVCNGFSWSLQWYLLIFLSNTSTNTISTWFHHLIFSWHVCFFFFLRMIRIVKVGQKWWTITNHSLVLKWVKKMRWFLHYHLLTNEDDQRIGQKHKNW